MSCCCSSSICLDVLPAENELVDLVFFVLNCPVQLFILLLEGQRCRLIPISSTGHCSAAMNDVPVDRHDLRAVMKPFGAFICAFECFGYKDIGEQTILYIAVAGAHVTASFAHPIAPFTLCAIARFWLDG